MNCCKNKEPGCGGTGCDTSAFIILVLYILLAIILGGILF